MNCPKCLAPMQDVTFQEITVERCTICQGLWFGADEHERLKKLKGSEVIDIGDPEVGRKQDAKGKIDCPVCKTPMLRMLDPKQPHLWFEACKICHGVYFDAGEFKDFKHETLLDFFRDLVPRRRT